MQAKVSILIPCYNGESVIDVGLESIYEQSYSNIEVVVVDDGSNDHSADKIFAWKERFIQRGFEIKYVFQENAGVGAAVNTGLKHITGKYLTLLDADDRYLPTSIEKRAKFLDNHPECTVVRSNGWKISGNEKMLFIQNDKEKKIENLFEAVVYGTTNSWAGTYMVRTDVLFFFYPEKNIFPSKYGQNLQILLPPAYAGLCGYIDEPLVEYILQPNSLTQTEEGRYVKEENNAEGFKEIYVHMINSIVKKERERERYLTAFNAAHYRCAMNRAISYNNKSAMKKYYVQLKDTGLATVQDKVIFHTANKHICLTLVYRIIRKLKEKKHE